MVAYAVCSDTLPLHQVTWHQSVESHLDMGHYRDSQVHLCQRNCILAQNCFERNLLLAVALIRCLSQSLPLTVTRRSAPLPVLHTCNKRTPVFAKGERERETNRTQTIDGLCLPPCCVFLLVLTGDKLPDSKNMLQGNHQILILS